MKAKGNETGESGIRTIVFIDCRNKSSRRYTQVAGSCFKRL